MVLMNLQISQSVILGESVNLGEMLPSESDLPVFSSSFKPRFSKCLHGVTEPANLTVDSPGRICLFRENAAFAAGRKILLAVIRFSVNRKTGISKNAFFCEVYTYATSFHTSVLLSRQSLLRRPTLLWKPLLECSAWNLPDGSTVS